MTIWESAQKNMTWRGVLIASVVAGTVFIVSSLMLTPVVFEVEASVLLR